MFAVLDELKNMKASIKNDFSTFRRLVVAFLPHSCYCLLFYLFVFYFILFFTCLFSFLLLFFLHAARGEVLNGFNVFCICFDATMKEVGR